VTWDGRQPRLRRCPHSSIPSRKPSTGEPQPDPETGEPVTPFEPTGLWLCEVRLREADAELAAMIEA